jgi:hypothetical protein
MEELDRFMEWIGRTFGGVGNIIYSAEQWVRNLEEKVDHWFQVFTTIVALTLAATVLLSWGKALIPAVMGVETGVQLAAAYYVAVVEVKPFLRVAAGTAAAHHLGGTPARLERSIRMGMAKIMLVGLAGVGLGWILVVAPIRDGTALSLWGTIAVTTLVAIVAPARSGLRMGMWIITIVFTVIAVTYSAVTVKESPLHAAAVVVAEHTEGTTEIVYVPSTTLPPPPEVQGGGALLDWRVIDLSQDYTDWIGLVWVEDVQWWVEAPGCTAGVVEVDSAGPAADHIPVASMPAQVEVNGHHRFRMDGAGCSQIIYYAVLPAG